MSYDFFLSGLNERHKNNFIEAINIIEEAKKEGFIRNVVYNEIKDRLNRACWDFDYKMKPRVRYDDMPYSIREFDSKINSIGLHSMISIRKKVDKMKERNEIVDFYDKLSGELLDLAYTMKDLKSKIVKGRIVKEPAPVNPNQIRKTCACCFRDIAISSDKTMVHHGFERPGNGYQTSSCPGIQFKYLEISNEGLKYMVNTITEALVSENNGLENLKNAKSLSFFNYSRKFITLNEGDDNFNYHKESEVRKQEYLIKGLERDLEFFKKKLQEWKPTETE